MRLWGLGDSGVNTYYAATVKSMTTSVAAFVFGSFDPALFVSVDKPAPGLWPQALAAQLLGFGNLALLLPQAIAGVLSVIVLSRIVARTHGEVAGAIAGVALAVAPVAVAVDRNNTMDAELVLVLLGAAWCAFRALERGPWWLLLAGVLIGIGFNIKMSQALIAAPAILVAYLVAARATPLARIAHLAAFGALMAVVSASWVVFVDLTPPDARPYVGSSRDNTALELAIGHNGLERLPQELLFWRGARPASGPPPNGAAPPPNAGSPEAVSNPTDEAGERGALRLFNAQLAGQISWYIPLALLGAAAIVARAGRRRPLSPAQVSVAFWLAWLIPAAILFSWSGIFHRYYLVMLAPPLAALVGAGSCALFILASSSMMWRAFAVVAAIFVALVDVFIAARSPDFAPWLPAVAAVGVVSWTVALWLRHSSAAPIRMVASLVALACFFAAPAAWASTTLAAADGALPFAGPELLRGRAPLGPRPAVPRGPVPASALLDYLLSEYRGERFLIATPTTMTAAELMLRTDRAAMAIGGFSGGDPILTTAAFERLVRTGGVRFVLLEGRIDPAILAWARTRCVEVPAARAGVVAGPPLVDGRPAALVDCARVRAQAP